MWKSKLFWRFFAVYAVLIALSGTALVSIFSARQRALMLNQLRSQLHHSALILANQSEEIIARGPDAKQQDWLKSVQAGSGVRLTVIDQEGKVVADSSEDPETMENHIDRPEVQMARLSGRGSAERVSPTLGMPMLYYALRVGEGDEPAGYVRASLPMTTVNEQIDRVQQIITGLAFALCVIALIATYVLVIRIVRPVQLMTEAAEQVSAGNLTPSLSVTTGDELETLADAFNAMSRQLDQRLQQLDRQNQDIRETSERLGTVLGAMIEGVVAVDDKERILFANRAAINMFDLPAKDLTERPLVEMIRHPKVHEVVQDVLGNRRHVTAEFELPRKEMVVSLIASRLPGTPASGVVMVFHDMTDLRRLENLRREFVSNVSHELKTPLASIQAYTDTLLEGGLEDSSINREFLKRIDHQAERLHMLILDVIKIAQIESGQEVFELTAVPLREIAEDCVREHEAVAEAKSIALTIAMPPDNGRVAVHADREGLRTILDNLIDNAIKYTPAGGKVSVSWESEDGRVQVRVTDTGVGIPPEHQSRIFERFYRVDKARSREMGGTGLGLSIVKHLAQVFGGTIAVESRQGEGSTFRVELLEA